MPSVRRLFPQLFALFVSTFPLTVSAQTAGSGNTAPLLLQRIIIPHLEFREATPADALQFLTRKASELDTTSPNGTKRRLEFAPQDLPETRVTLSLQNVSLDEAFGHVAALAGLRLTYTADGIRVDADPKGSPSKLGSRLDSSDLSASQQRLIAKARGLVVPKVEFREATIREAVDFLRHKSKQTGEPQPSERVINVVLIGGSAYDAIPRLTLTEHNKPVLDLLTAFARIAGGELRVTNSAFVLDFSGVKAGQLP